MVHLSLSPASDVYSQVTKQYNIMSFNELLNNHHDNDPKFEYKRRPK